MNNQPRHFSFPHAFETRMKNSLGIHWDMFAHAHLQTTPVSIRINPAKHKVYLPPVPWSNYGYYLNERPVFTLDPLFHAGAYYVQEASSLFLEQVVRQAADLTKPLRVLDLCAAPGGKSTHLLSLLSPDSLLISNEVIRSRAQVLWENIQKWGHANVIVTNSDPSAFQQLNGYFDIILVDAPCSGEGLFRKDPAACSEWSEDNVTLCSQRQRRILNDVWPALKQNGLLIYSTCTYNKHENEENLDAWAGAHDIDFFSVQLQPEWNVETISFRQSLGYRFYPHRVQGEGFFISAMIKRETTESTRIKTGGKLNAPSAKIIDRIKPWVDDPNLFQWGQHDDLIIQIPVSVAGEVEWISKLFYPLGKGTAVAELKHDKLIPEHAFALSNAINGNAFQTTDLNEADAIAYLRKDALTISEGLKGFGLVRFKNQNLGWVNHLGNRTNNLYPSNWRIRMAAGTNPLPE
ncbi:MAG: rRNA methyltransferase [Cyclobacteriaceae bacterium]|nr:rRNA methyltransferase [Cyclobacteriaceae bacterium]